MSVASFQFDSNKGPQVRAKKLRPGELITLAKFPDGLLAGLRDEDQRAISSIIGKPILFVGYDEDGRVELEFTDDVGVIHSVYLSVDVPESSM